MSFEGRIALLEGPSVLRPGGDESGFHVEHSPVQPPTAIGRTLLHQAVDPWIHDLHGQRLGELGQRPGVPPPYAGLQTVLAVEA